LLDRTVSRPNVLSVARIHRSDLRLTQPAFNLQADELLGPPVEWQLKARREARCRTGFRLDGPANRHVLRPRMTRPAA
jgi:hypothetical protein